MNTSVKVNTRGKVSGSALLKAKVAVVGFGHVPSMTCIPKTVDSRFSPLSALVVSGTFTQWDTNLTNWTIKQQGTLVTGSSFSVGSPVWTAWALQLRKGAGTIVLSDGTCSTTVTVL